MHDCPPRVARFSTPGQVFITPGTEYAVHALAIFEGDLAFQIVDDLRYPAWVSSWFFEVRDPSIPSDWICNAFHDEPLLVIGPDFIARDRESYGAMVELDAEQVDRFWKRAELHDNSGEDDERG
jgi:hypothetical protein